MADTEDNKPASDVIEPNPAETIATQLPTRSMDETQEPESVEVEETPAEEVDPAPEAPAEPEKAKPKLDWKEQRRIEETNKRRIAEARAEEAERKLAALTAKPDATTTDQPISREEARRLARLELEAEDRAASFKEATGRVLQQGLKAIPDFEEARQEMVANFGEQLNARPDFFEAITDADIPNGHDVFYHLAKDPEQTERLLGMPPSKMAIQIAKLSDKLSKAADASDETPVTPQKTISKAPPPVKPINANPTASNRLDDANLPMDQFADTFLKGLKKKFG